jgi:L,D-transpeptidase YcbB
MMRAAHCAASADWVYPAGRSGFGRIEQKKVSPMVPLRPAAPHRKAKAFVLAALLAAGGGMTGAAWGQATPAVEPQPTAAALPEAPKPESGKTESNKPESSKPDASPAALAETAPAASAPAAALAEVQAPEKPALNRAVRAALIRASGDSARLSAEARTRRQAVDAFYAERGDAPLWLDHGQWTPAARAAFERLQDAGEDGLNLSATRVYALGKGPDASLALGDVALSQAVAEYAAQASGGRLDPRRLSKLIGAQPPVVAPAQALDEVSKAADANAALRGYNPAHPGYALLRERLAQARLAPATLAHLADSAPSRRTSDATASIAPRGGGAQEAEILVNMEFWRWLPRDLGADRIFVNVPEFTGRLYRDNALAMSFRVVTGKPDTPTPIFSDMMDYIVVNPSWNVPQSIIKNEMSSKLESLRAQGYEITYSNGQTHIRQPPGERNALGHIKFIFPNDFSVYMHDTPSRRLFSEDVRAFSHGCVRVDEPIALAEAILRPERGWTEARLRKMIGKTERRIDLPQKLPVHIAYFTLAADEFGDLRAFDDIYGYARKTRQALGLGG